ncbi:hypothetical protein [Saccharolobus caldissimus]|uniref:Uncharacterized protein n=1 Tax=Saccharolobus caldissimus TaxID=1702097 RepID=A0AAQ4CQU9_9CREN|nr:hypothetical protein [Saccharolobus caldissimus]BDB98180.1 hypothetical protein SACC_11970 [Saccharolobus caldissimus]
MSENEGWTLHKGLINVSDTIVYILGWVILLLGFGIDVIGVQSHNANIVAIGIAVNWIGILIGIFSGVIGNRRIPPGYGEHG